MSQRLLTGGIFHQYLAEEDEADLLRKHAPTYGTSAPEPPLRHVKVKLTAPCRCGYPLVASDSQCPRCHVELEVT